MSVRAATTRLQVEEVLRNVLKETQELMGDPVTEVGEETRPVGDLMGFDSLCAVSATTAIAEQLNLEKLDSKLFWSPQTGKPLTFREITDRLCSALKIRGNRE